MKHIIIGDLHGKDCWRTINIKKYDKVVFIGDYTDAWTLSDLAIYQNLQNIIKLKKRNWDKVVLLLGNHDIQYLYFPRFQCSGFRPTMQMQLTALFKNNKDCFQVAYQKGDHIFTHAGITNAWYNAFLRIPILETIRDEKDTLADLLNKVDQTSMQYLLHATGHVRGGKDNGGITWADRKETATDMLKGFHQVVGHTVVDEIHTITLAGRSVTYIDVLDNDDTAFYELDC
jgi:UDP-2,3-diacylglucosamine pyrophosphatase LpxH